MGLLTYSTDSQNALNQQRLQLWCAKGVLAEANRRNDNEMRGRAMSYINKDRIALRNLCHELRAKLPAKKVYRIAMRGEALDFIIWERAHSRGQAMEQAAKRYPDFHFDSVEVVE